MLYSHWFVKKYLGVWAILRKNRFQYIYTPQLRKLCGCLQRSWKAYDVKWEVLLVPIGPHCKLANVYKQLHFHTDKSTVYNTITSHFRLSFSDTGMYPLVAYQSPMNEDILKLLDCFNSYSPLETQHNCSSKMS